MMLADADRAKLLPHLDRLAAAIEELLMTGLTAASEATRQSLGVTFQEASRLRLLRLGGTLRVANEELGRYTRNDGAFSQRRLVFFLGRAWLLSRGLARAYRNNDDAEADRLLGSTRSAPAPRLDVVTLGVVKKVAQGAFCAFDFRLRTVADAGDLPRGSPLSWSVVFPLKAGIDVPPEGYLHLPQEQKFTPAAFLDRRVLTIERAQLSREEGAAARLSFTKETTVVAGEPFTDWTPLLAWNPQAAIDRIARHVPNPFDLEVELHEEVALGGWDIGDWREPTADGRRVAPLHVRGVELDASVSASSEGDAARKSLDELRAKPRRPPLFGLLHYESCRMVLQPLATFDEHGPKYLTISDESIDRKSLLQTMKFT